MINVNRCENIRRCTSNTACFCLSSEEPSIVFSSETSVAMASSHKTKEFFRAVCWFFSSQVGRQPQTLCPALWCPINWSMTFSLSSLVVCYTVSKIEDWGHHHQVSHSSSMLCCQCHVKCLIIYALSWTAQWLTQLQQEGWCHFLSDIYYDQSKVIQATTTLPLLKHSSAP